MTIVRRFSEEHRKKIAEATRNTQFKTGGTPWNKGLKGYHPDGVGFKKGAPAWNKGISVQLNTGRTHFKSGENSLNWKGGVSNLTARIRSSSQYSKWRADVYRRDGWTCQTCGYRGHGKDIDAHHIVSLKDLLKKTSLGGISMEDRYLLAMAMPEVFDVNNGVTLCKPCHKLTY